MTTMELLKAATAAAPSLARADRDTKDRALNAMAQALLDQTEEILAANERDLEAARGLSLIHISEPTRPY